MSQQRYAYLMGANGPEQMALRYAESDALRLAEGHGGRASGGEGGAAGHVALVISPEGERRGIRSG